jgi:trehalose 2-sulfotransferase
LTQIADRFAYEFDVAAEPRVSYMICSVPRSGSSLLCELLANTLHAGMPAEYLRPDVIARLKRRWGAAGFDDYLSALVERKTSPNGVFGLKVHRGQYEATLADRDPAGVFPNLRFVEVRRADRLRQAISWVRAQQTGNWSSLIGPAEPRPAVFDRAEIERKLTRLEREQAGWEEFFARHAISPHRISYEELAEAPEETVRALLAFLGVELPSGVEIEAPLMQRQTDEVSEGWVARYRAESAPA